MKTLLALGMVLVFAPACGELSDPPTPVGTPEEETIPNDPTLPVDPNLPPAAPSLNSLPARYGYATIPVRGTAAASETVFVEGGKSPVATDTDTTGNFCVDVPLTPNLTQVLKVYVQNDSGLTSEPAEATVKYDPALAQTETPEQPLVDLAADVVAKADETPKSGVLDNLTDGDLASTATMPKSTIWLDLGDIYELSSIEIVFPDAVGQGTDTFATHYVVFVSTDAQPTEADPPYYLDSDWTVLYDVCPNCGLPYGDGGSDEFVLSVPVEARYVAFYLYENNKTDWFSSEEIKVGEIKVIGRSTEALPPVPQTPTCANGREP